MILDTKKKMGGKPVIVIVQASNPCVASEFEGRADSILLSFQVEPRALLDLITGGAEPSALLPFQMPRDMIPYTDTCGNTWDFAFGLNWKGVIEDGRTRRYINDETD
jgi:beta-glucosidase